MYRKWTALNFAVSFITVALIASMSYASVSEYNQIKRYLIPLDTPIDDHEGCVYKGEIRDMQVTLAGA